MNLINYVGEAEQNTKLELDQQWTECDCEVRRKHSIGFSFDHSYNLVKHGHGF